MDGVLALLMIATGTVILIKEARPLFVPDQLPLQPAGKPGFRSPDSIKFDDYMKDARASLSNGNLEDAKTLFKDALSLDQIALVHAAEPMKGLAEILIDEGRYNAAGTLASIAARLNKGKPDYVNPYAKILIETCRFAEAIDMLKGLQLDQDLESRRLLEAAETNAAACERSGQS